MKRARRKATGRGAKKPHRFPTQSRGRGPAAAVVARFGSSRRTHRRSSPGRLARCSIRTAPTDAIGKTRNNRDEPGKDDRSEEHTSELQSLMSISYAVFCLTKKTKKTNKQTIPYVSDSNKQKKHVEHNITSHKST